MQVMIKVLRLINAHSSFDLPNARSLTCKIRCEYLEIIGLRGANISISFDDHKNNVRRAAHCIFEKILFKAESYVFIPSSDLVCK